MTFDLMTKSLLVFLVAGVQYLANGDASRREHKVHNIVLYPERHSWCQTTPIKQIVAMPGFDPITIDNNVCVGACYSYSIPRTQPAEPGELIGPYCDSCQPKETQCYHVTLKSPSPAGKSMQKRVQIISNCSCSSCSRQQQRLDATDCDLTDINTSELPTNLFSALANQDARADLGQEVPELMTVGSAPIGNTTGETIHHIITPARTYDLKLPIRGLLIQIQDADEEELDDESERDNVLMKQLLELVSGPDEKLTDKDVMEFVNYVNEHFDYDLDSLKLKSALEKFRDALQSEELRVRHRNFGLGHIQVGTPLDALDDEDDDIVQAPVITGIEGSHLGLGPKKGSHIGMGIAQPKTDQQRIDVNSIADEDEAQSQTPSAHAHRHRVGEEQHLLGGGVAHLVMGPHGSLVAAPVEEKLDLESHEVAPNQEGAVIDYHHHSNKHHHHHHHHQQEGSI